MRAHDLIDSAAAAFSAESKGAKDVQVGGAGMGYTFVLVSHGSSGDRYHSVVN